jgi:F420-non-reducing hydrogenase small subunit
MAKLKLAAYWSASCGGCDVAILDLHERILELANIADIVFWPIAVDFKYHHVEAMPDKFIDVCLFNGGVRSSEQEHIAKLLRAKSKLMIAYGACACFGGIPSLANFFNRAQIMERVYIESPSSVNPNHILPQTLTTVAEGQLELPELYDTVKNLAQVVEADYFVPGCPPVRGTNDQIVDVLASGELPPKGAVIASAKALCEECTRKKEEKKITRIYRPFEIIPDPEKCLLEQGLICMGPATRGGCGSKCIKVNMPCRGCYGPPPGVIDQGAKMLSALASIYDVKDDDGIERLKAQAVDAAGTFYRFSLADSLLNRKRM